MGTIDKFPALVELLKNRKYSPTKIAKELEADKRTVDKMIEVGTKLNILTCESIEVSGRKFMSCTVSENFKKISKDKEVQDAK